MSRETGFTPHLEPSPENKPMKPLINELGLNFKINNLKFQYEQGFLKEESFKKGVEDILVEDLKKRLKLREIDLPQYDKEFESIPNQVKEIVENS